MMNLSVLYDKNGAHIPVDGDPSASSVTATPEQIAKELYDAQQRLREVPIDDIIGLLDAAGKIWTTPGHAVTGMILKLSLGFLPMWLRQKNLTDICDLALRGNRLSMDGFVPALPSSKRLHRAQPRGILVHWVAGNVPLLGMISLVQGLLSKNANLVKVSHRNAGILPFFLQALSQVSYTNANGDIIEGKLLTGAVCAVYASHEDFDAARALSTLADVRIAWGGREAVEAIMNLPRRFGTEDIIFGPKTSFAVVGAEMLADEGTARRTAHLLALDTVAIEQRGCNSPHTVFVESGARITPEGFAALLGNELRGICESMPPPNITTPEAFRVQGLRAEYDMRGEAWYGDEVTWSVFYSDEDQGLAEPCYARTLFVRAVDDIFSVADLCSVNTQSAGLALGERRLALADALTSHGIERCPELGRMSLYGYPWDGMYPIDRMVRWVSA